MTLHANELAQMKKQIVEVHLLSLESQYQATLGEYRNDIHMVMERMMIQSQIDCLNEELKRISEMI